MTQVAATTDSINATLGSASTTFFGMGGDSSIVQSMHLQWDAVLVATVTFEDSNFPDVALNSTNAGDWIQENPPDAATYVAFSPVGAGTKVGLTITIPGGTAGGCIVHFGNMGTARMRGKIVATTGGKFRARPNGKE